MKLSKWLQQQDENVYRFAIRAQVQRVSVNRILAGEGCTLLTASKIVQATGGSVSFLDLLPEDEVNHG